MSGPRGGSRSTVRSGKFTITFLYEDDDIIAVDKPCGMPTIAPEGSRTRSLYDVITDHIRRRNPKGRAAVVHRLDRDTSGVIVFAKNAAAKTALMSTWNESVDERLYIALIEGSLPSPEGTLDTWLSESDPFLVREVPAGTKGSLRAITHYRVMAEGDGLSLVELSLETGRRHQIRAQLAGAGCPVAGDERYGARRDPIGRLGLHAAVISLKRPSSSEPLRLECPPPAMFGAALKGSADQDRGRSPRAGGAPRDSRGPRGSSGTRSTRAPSGRSAPEPAPKHASRAWPGGGPTARSRKSAGGEAKSSSRYSTRARRKP